MSMRAAINAKCRECIYDPMPGNGTWRQQVEACTSYGYPLYPLRPKAEKGANSVSPQDSVLDIEEVNCGE